MTFDRRRSELEARSLRRLDLPRVYHENQIAELDAHNFPGINRPPSAASWDNSRSHRPSQTESRKRAAQVRDG